MTTVHMVSCVPHCKYFRF